MSGLKKFGILDSQIRDAYPVISAYPTDYPKNFSLIPVEKSHN